MRKTLKILWVGLFLIVLCGCASACGGGGDYAQIESVTVQENEDGPLVFLLSEFDVSDIKLSIKYFDTYDDQGNVVPGEVKGDVPVAEYMINYDDKAKLTYSGEKSIDILYGKFVVPCNLRLIDEKKPEFSVKFFGKDGNSLGDPQYVPEGGGVQPPPVPPIAGYTFEGWKDRETGEIVGLYDIRGNLSLEAVYFPKEYEVAYYTRVAKNSPDGKVWEEAPLGNPVKVPRGGDAYSELYAPAIPAKPGYKRGEWEIVPENRKVEKEGLKCYAVYETERVNVTFLYKRDSTETRPRVLSYFVGETIANPPDKVEQAGFKFLGWKIRGNDAVFPYTVKCETTFEAVYGNLDTDEGTADGEGNVVDSDNGLTYGKNQTSEGDYYYSVSGLSESFTGGTVVIPRSIRIETADGTNESFEVRRVEPDAFKGRPVVEFVVMPENLYFRTENGVLFNRSAEPGEDKTVLYAYPSRKKDTEYALPDTVARVCEYAFYSAENLTKITLNAALTNIGEYAFSDCVNLTGMDIPENVVKIGEHAFYMTSANVFKKINFAPVSESISLEIGSSAFRGLENVEEIALPRWTTSLGDDVFTGCERLSKITVDDENAYFMTADGALYGADSDKNPVVLYHFPASAKSTGKSEFTVNEHCVEIKSGAFSKPRLHTIDIPSGVSVISEGAINCPVLAVLIWRGALDNLPPFIGGGDTDVYIDKGIFEALSEDERARYKVIPEDPNDIPAGYIYSDESGGTRLIYEMCGYTEKTASGAQSKTGVRILESCGTEPNLVIPPLIRGTEVVEIGKNAFRGDSFIETVTLPAGLRKIFDWAFAETPGLRAVYFSPDSRPEFLGDSVFKDCRSLVSANGFPEPGEDGHAVEHAGAGLFENTPFRDKFPGDFVTLGTVLVKYNGLDIRVAVPDKITYIAPDAFKNRSEIVRVTFGDGSKLKYIGEFAFQNCDGIAEIKIPSAVIRVGEGAFDGCDKLKLITASGELIAGDLSESDRCPEGVLIRDENETAENRKNLTYKISEGSSETVSGELIIEPYIPDETSEKRFAGWYTEPDGGGTLVTFPLALTSDMTIYAKYIGADEYTRGLNFKFVEEGQYYTVESYTGADEYVVVPKKVDFHRVRGISNGAFKNTDVRYIELPHTTAESGYVTSDLEKIGKDVFEGTPWLDNFAGAFIFTDDFLIKYRGNSAEVTIPEHIAKIARGAFAGNSFLKKVVLPAKLTVLDDGVFEGCEKLEEVVLPAELRAIGDGAFFGCLKLDKINFADCKKLSDIRRSAFEGTAWLKNYPDDCVMINGVLYAYLGNAPSLRINNEVKAIGEKAFFRNSVLKDVYIPQNVSSIGDEAFAETKSLSGVYIYEGTVGGKKEEACLLKSISDGAFRDSGLRSVNLSAAVNLENIGKEAFGGCHYLERLNIPSDVVKIGEGAFGSSALSEVRFASGSNLKEIPKKAFFECYNLRRVEFDGASKLVLIGERAFSDSSLETFVNRLARVEFIADGAFCGCTRLTDFYVNESALNEIGEKALEETPFLNLRGPEVILGNIYVKYNGYDSAVLIPDNVTTIYNGAFEGNQKITEIAFGELSALRNINAKAFSGCVRLERILQWEGETRLDRFPKSVEYVAGDAFTGTAWEEARKRDDFIIAANTLIKYNYDGVRRQVKVPDGVERISAGAFDGAEVYDITLGPDVKFIEDGALEPATYSRGTGDEFRNAEYFKLVRVGKLPSSFPNVYCVKTSETVYTAADTSAEPASGADYYLAVSYGEYNAGSNPLSGAPSDYYTSDGENTVFSQATGEFQANTEYFKFVRVGELPSSFPSVYCTESGTGYAAAGGTPDHTAEYYLAVSYGEYNAESNPLSDAPSDYYTFDEWTLTIIPSEGKDAEPSVLEQRSLSAAHIYIDGEGMADRFRNDEKWGASGIKEKISPLLVFDIAFQTKYVGENGLDEVKNSVSKLHALYEEAPDENVPESYMFIGWYCDEGRTQAVSYPFYFTENTTLYAKIIGGTAGSYPERYSTDGSAITGYNQSGPEDRRHVVISELGGVELETIGGRTTAEGAFIGAFEGVSGVEEIYFAKNSKIRTIGEYAFRNCSDLRKIVIPATVTAIGKGAFENCANLREIVFEEGKGSLTLGEEAFSGCTSLTEITLPTRLSSLGDKAFTGCENLKSVHSKTNPPITLTPGLRPFDLPSSGNPAYIVYIPAGSAAAYGASWKDYKNCLQEEK